MTAENIFIIKEALVPGIGQTLYMVVVSTIFATLIGLPLGIILHLTKADGISPKPILNQCLSTIINVTRSFPFLILLIVLMPISRFVVGTAIGATAVIVPLSIGAAPFVARLVEQSLMEIPKGMIEAALSMGVSIPQLILKVLLPEALPSLVLGFTNTTISLIGYSAMAGAIGGGGLGDIAIRYGYQMDNTFIMFVTVVVLIVLVQAIQWIGNFVAFRLLNK